MGSSAILNCVFGKKTTQGLDDTTLSVNKGRLHVAFFIT